MHDQPTPMYYTDPRTGVVYVVQPNTPSAEGEVVAFEPRGVLPDAETERSALQGFVNRGKIIIAYQPPLKVEASGPKNIFANRGEQYAVVCAAEGYQSEAMTAVVRVADPGEIAGLVDVNMPQRDQVVTSAREFGPADTDPFTALAAPAALGLPTNILQQIEIVGYLIQGHEDLSFETPFNMPCGQIIRLAATGSSIKVKARIIPRYFQKFGASPDFQYIVAGTTLAADRERNRLFDNPPNDVLAQTMTGDGIPSTGVQVQGYVGRGFSAPVPPSRIFFGAIDNAAGLGVRYRCPIARGAQTVFLASDATNANNDALGAPDFAGTLLGFNQICGNNGRRELNQPGNVTVPLRSDCTAIEVFNITNPTVQGIPFELQFDLGF